MVQNKHYNHARRGHDGTNQCSREAAARLEVTAHTPLYQHWRQLRTLGTTQTPIQFAPHSESPIPRDQRDPPLS